MICLLLHALANICELDLCPFWNVNCPNAPSLCQSLHGLSSQFAESDTVRGGDAVWQEPPQGPKKIVRTEWLTQWGN